MILYHGSNISVETPRLLPSERKLDFGSGFYLTSSLEQAERWALLKQKRCANGEAVVSVYEVDDALFQRLTLRVFAKPHAAWLRYILANRRGKGKTESADVVVGPVANDQTMPALSMFLLGELSVPEVLRRLRPQQLKDQYAFKTQNALLLLKFKEALIK